MFKYKKNLLVKNGINFTNIFLEGDCIIQDIFYKILIMWIIYHYIIYVFCSFSKTPFWLMKDKIWWTMSINYVLLTFILLFDIVLSLRTADFWLKAWKSSEFTNGDSEIFNAWPINIIQISNLIFVSCRSLF